MQSQASSEDTPLSSSQVKWQTVFWAIIPIATIVINRPSGRILSSTSRYRIYIRSSPIICALDALFFLVRILISPFLLGVTVRQAVRLTIRERYVNIEDTVDGDLRSFKKQAWMRWVFFLVGTLGPTVKLAAMQGVPWTKAWGMMFLGAFVVFEGMVFVSTKDMGLKEQGDQTAQEEDETLPPGFIHRISDMFEGKERFLYRAGLIIHWMVLIWAVIDMWSLRGPVLEKAAVALFILVLLLTCAPFLYMVSASLDMLRDTFNQGAWFWVIFSFFLVGFAGSTLCLLGACIIILKREWCDFLIFLSICGFVPILRFCIGILCATFPRLGMSLLVVSYSENATSRKIDKGAVDALVFFLVNVFICLLWYWLKYNPEGTGVPNWTVIFG